VLARTWQEMAARQHTYLRSITFADLAERTKGVAEQMYYI
jgi:DNA-binding IscR family transcriptional regulator